MSYGISEDDRRMFSNIADARERKTADSNLDNQPEDSRPPLPVRDGHSRVVELRGSNNTRVHRPDPDSESARPWCLDQPCGYNEGASRREFKSERLEVAVVWSPPCACCFPNGYPETEGGSDE